MSEKTDKELAIITTIKRHEYENLSLIEADNLIKERNININAYISEDEIQVYKKSLVPDIASIPLTIFEKILSFISSWLIYFIIRYVLYLVTGIPIDLLSIVSLPLTIIFQVYIFRVLKNKGFMKRAADFKNWVLNAYILMASLFLLDRVMSFLFGSR